MLVVVRQVFNAAPLAFFVPGITFTRATVSDLGAATVATVAPPPADLVVRFAMFRAWGIDMVRGTAGLTLNTVLFYVLRFAAPVFGFFVLIVINRYDDQVALVALVSGVAAVVVSTAIILVVRSERGAAWVGRTAGRIVQRVRPAVADPAEWEERMRAFRVQVAEDLRRRWWAASLALVLMLMTEALLLLLAVRFAGVPATAAASLAIVGAFCVTFPLTALPVGGLGVLDAALFGLLMLETNREYEAEIIAALVIWRAATMVLPLILGGITLLFFRRSQPEAFQEAESRLDDAGSDEQSGQ